MISFDIKKRLNAPGGTMNLEIAESFEEGSITALFGPSGAGKSSLLRMVAGLMKPDSGWIKKNNESWFDSAKKTNIKARFRKIAFVFQETALFPNMTIYQNMQYALHSDYNDDHIKSFLELMELGDLAHAKPNKLSGGQKRRAALARALSQNPKIMFLDEPFTGLDDALKGKLQQYIIKIHKEFGLTLVLVSHDIRDVLLLSQRIIKIQKGKIEKSSNIQEFINERKNGDGLSLKARVIAEPNSSGHGKILVLIGENIFELSTNQKNISKGDWITVSTDKLKII